MTTETEKTSLSFGRYLQSIRIEKGISLEDVSRETRIRRDALIHIEEEDHEKLPDIVFVKGFLRAYAKAIGADGDEAVSRYISRLEVMQRITTSDLDLERTGGVFWRRFLLSIGALFCLIAVTLYAVSMWRDKQTQTSASSGTIAGAVPAESAPAKSVQVPADTPAIDKSAPATTEPPPQANAATTAESAGDLSKEPAKTEAPVALEDTSVVQVPITGYRLSVDAIEETWMKIVIDNQEPKEYNLYPGDQIELEATDSYSLLVGNAGGIKLRLNDKQVELSGKSGKVVTLKLP
jgi:cytoskeletal protein RodZ